LEAAVTALDDAVTSVQTVANQLGTDVAALIAALDAASGSGADDSAAVAALTAVSSTLSDLDAQVVAALNPTTPPDQGTNASGNPTTATPAPVPSTDETPVVNPDPPA
jgi:hypothetical protein